MMILESSTIAKVRVATLRMDITPTNELVVTDAKPTKLTRKRRAPMGEITSKDELGCERSNEREFGVDGKNDAIIGESCN